MTLDGLPRPRRLADRRRLPRSRERGVLRRPGRLLRRLAPRLDAAFGADVARAVLRRADERPADDRARDGARSSGSIPARLADEASAPRTARPDTARRAPAGRARHQRPLRAVPAPSLRPQGTAALRCTTGSTASAAGVTDARPSASALTARYADRTRLADQLAAMGSPAPPRGSPDRGDVTEARRRRRCDSVVERGVAHELLPLVGGVDRADRARLRAHTSVSVLAPSPQ